MLVDRVSPWLQGLDWSLDSSRPGNKQVDVWGWHMTGCKAWPWLLEVCSERDCPPPTPPPQVGTALEECQCWLRPSIGWGMAGATIQFSAILAPFRPRSTCMFNEQICWQHSIFYSKELNVRFCGLLGKWLDNTWCHMSVRYDICQEYIIFSEEIVIIINKYSINYVRLKEVLRVILCELSRFHPILTN